MLSEGYKKRIAVLAGLNENLRALSSFDRTANEKYIEGNYVIFNYFVNDAHGDKPYRFIGKIISNSKYNQLDVEVIRQLKEVIVRYNAGRNNPENQAKAIDYPLYNLAI